MRVVIALLKHETNTFSPVPTPLSRFGNGGPAWGEDAFRAYKGTATPMGAFIDLAEAEGADIVTPVAAEAWPSGPVHDDAYARLTNSILAEVAKGCDCVLLDLHGAMVTESLEDGEGELLARIRALAPDVPVGVALDLHGNLSQKIVGNATAIAGFKTYPHVDMYETGERVGRITLRALKGLSRPTMVWGNRPMLPHIMRMGTAEAPMRDLVDAARGFEEDGALAVSVFGGFPHADIHDAGISVVTVTEDDRDSAETICNGLLDVAWNRREEFVYRRRAAGPVRRPRTGSGGWSGAAAGPFRQLRFGRHPGRDRRACARSSGRASRMSSPSRSTIPRSVAKLIEAGVGAEVTLDIGGKLPMPAIGLAGKPLSVTGKVRVITDGEYTIRGPMYTGVRVGMGRTVVLDTGNVEIVLIERHHEPWDLGCLLSLGIDPAARKYIMLKSRIHYRAGFQPIARHIVECAGEGVTTSDYSRLRFDRVRRPIFPLN